MRYIILDNYDPQKPVGFVELNDDISEEQILDRVIAPQIKLETSGNKIMAYGIFPIEALDKTALDQAQA